MRAAIYTRVSSDPRERGRSVAEQLEECRSWVDREGWELSTVYSDNDRSASRYAKKERPDYERLFMDIDSGRIDVLVVWEISRTTRDRMVWAVLVEACIDRGVKLCVGGRVHDLEDPDDAFTLDLASSLAVRESGVTRKRVLRAVRSNAAKGRPHGRLLYGYRREYDPTSGELVAQVPDGVTGPIVQEATRRVLAGETPYAVAHDLNRRGVPTPSGADGARWDLTQVKRLCVNPGYAGLRVHQGKVVGDAAWPPLVDAATHHGLVARLGDPTRRTQRDSAVRHLLSGLAVCGTCGGGLRVQKNRGFLAYLCVDGFHVSRREDFVDSVVEAVTVARLSAPDILPLLADDEDDAEVGEALAEAREKRARLEAFYDAAAAGDLTPAALARIEARLLPEIEDAERRARRSGLPPVVADVAGPDAAAKWEALSIPQKREVIDALMVIRILPTTRGARTPRPEHIGIEWRTE
jgi:site-specific DNA recombinase